MSEESLAHFGIPGQKWGVRRYQNEDRTYTEEGKLRYAKNHDEEDHREWKAKDAKDLSDKELRDRIARLQLEKAYTQLFETPKVQNNGFQKPQKQNNKGGGIMKKIFFATAVTALSTVVQGKYQDFFKAKADKFIDSVKRNRTATKTAAEVAKTIKDTAVADNAWDAYKKMLKHSDENSLSFLGMKVGDLCLEHHGIKGQKWGIRRYQNEDGSLTEEGRARYSKDLDKRHNKTINENFRLRDEYIHILERNNPHNKADGEHEIPEKDKKRIQEIGRKLHDNRKKLEEIDYEIAKQREDTYKETVAQEQDSKWIDPKYRKFSSKEEKAAAEEAYFKRLEKEPDDENDRGKWEREVSHMSNTVWNMSMNGYEGIPKSERQKKEHDYVDTMDSFDRYDNWRPKYESTGEWKDLQSKKESIRKSFGFSETLESANKVKTLIDFRRIMNKYEKDRKEFKKMTEDITKREKEIETEFNNKIIKNVCLDLGYEPTDANLKYLEWWIWYD